MANNQWVDQWKDEQYVSDFEILSYPFCQWNAKNLAYPPIHINVEQAELAAWQGGATWQKAQFSYEKKIGRPAVTANVYQCNTPIISFVKLYRERWVYRVTTPEHKKGEMKPEHEPIDRKLHIRQSTYIIGILEPEKGGGYRLLHNSPISWTPKGVVGAKFALECLRPFSLNIQRFFGADVPRFIFAMELHPKISVVGDMTEQQTEIWVPTLKPPTEINTFKSLYVGDNTASTLKEWYDSVSQAQRKIDLPEDTFAAYDDAENSHDDELLM